MLTEMENSNKVHFKTKFISLLFFNFRFFNRKDMMLL